MTTPTSGTTVSRSNPLQPIYSGSTGLDKWMTRTEIVRYTYPVFPRLLVLIAYVAIAIKGDNESPWPHPPIVR